MATAPHHTNPSKIKALARIRDRHPGTDCEAQRQRLRAALAQYAITTFEGTRYLDCYDTRKRVSELRNEGVCIKTVWCTTTTESGQRHRIGRYLLDSNKPNTGKREGAV